MSVPRVRIDFGGGLEDVALPYNWREIKFQALFTDEFPSSQLQSILFEWRGPVAIKINKYFTDGLLFGTGIGEGIPLEISVGVPEVKFNVIIDLTHPSTEFEPDIVKTAIKRIGSIDWFSDLLESITFNLLSITPIPGFKTIIGLPNSGAKYSYKQVPYVVTIPEDLFQAISMIMEEYSLISALKTNISITSADISDFAKDLENLIDDGIGALMLVEDTVVMILDIAFDIFLVGAIVGNVEMMVNQYGLCKKYKYAMLVRDHISAVIDYINFIGAGGYPTITWKSSIFSDPASGYYDLTLMPKKILKENSSISFDVLHGGKATRGTEIGIPNTYGYYDYDAKRFLSEILRVFNAKATFIGNELNIEELHFFNNHAGVQLPNVDKPGFNFNWPLPNGTNWQELAWYYRIAFAIDSMEERTSIVYTGTSCAVTIQPLIVKNVANIIPPKSQNITFDFSLAKRKQYLNVMENVVNDILKTIKPIHDKLADVTSTLSGLVGGGSVKEWPTDPLSGLIGCMEVSGDQWEEPKLFIGNQVSAYNIIDGSVMDEWQIHPLNSIIVNAFAIMEVFHGKNLATRGNQWVKYKNKRMPIGSNQFNAILNNNVFNTADGKFGKFDKANWHISDDELQDMDYQINHTYTKNIYETISIDGS